MAWLLLGCLPDLSQVLEDETGLPDTGSVQVIEDQVVSLSIDATDYEAWISYDLDTLAITDGDDWDLGFRRYLVRISGGESGDGGWEVAWLEGADFETLDLSEHEPVWITDDADLPDDTDEEPEYAFNDWYDYDVDTHELSPKTGCWVLRRDEGEPSFKLVFDSYYSEAGTPAVLALRLAPLEHAP